MGIFRRVHKLVSADIHGMIDLLEDPVDSCKQAMREMEEEVAVLKQSTKKRDDSVRHIEEQTRRITERRQEAERALEVCLAGNDEGLIRQVIKKKLEHDKLLRVLVDQREALLTEQARECKQVTEYQERLTGVREKLACFSERESAAQRNPLAAEFNEPLHVSDEEVEVALLRMRQSQAAAV